MKIALAQINPVIADIEGNRDKIISFIEEARNLGAEMAVFPEMSTLGYPPMDLLENRRLIEKNIESINIIASACRGISAVCGFIDFDRTNPPMLYNSAAFMTEGAISSVHHKSLLPAYDVFDELRYFSAAHTRVPAVYRDCRLGITVCEDIWRMEALNDPIFMEQRCYSCDPVHDLTDQGAEIIINISASPFVKGKHRARINMISEIASSRKVPVVYVNQVGGNDSLIFDGNSFAVNSSGKLIAHCESFKEGITVFNTESAAEISYSYPPDIEEIRQALVLGLRDYAKKCGFTRLLVGLSGGIDSALTAYIAAEALGPENVTGITMPSKFSSKGSVDDSVTLADNLGIKIETIPIHTLYENFKNSLSGIFSGMAEDVTEENIQARARGVLLMAVSNKTGALLLTTGNKSEIATGYCTLYGDMCGGLAVISDLPKTAVYEMSRHINLKQEIIPWPTIEKPPSAELRENQTDQDSLPPYDVLDSILELYIEKRKSAEDIIAAGFKPEVVADVLKKVNISEYKRLQAAPGLKVTSKAFGNGRRVPVAKKFIY
jgi:NAD+ synthase (glutamine-hydrolysing)